MNTVRVQRANVILDIPADEKDRYVEMGYSVIDPVTGAILQRAVPNDVLSLKAEVNRLLDELKLRDAKIEKLEKQLNRKNKKQSITTK